MANWRFSVSTSVARGVPDAPKPRLILGAIVSIPGLFNLLSYAGLIPWYRNSRYPCRAVFCDPYHWQVGAFGLAFLCAGLAFMIPPRYPKLGALISLTLIGSLLGAIIGTFFFAR